MRCFFFDLISGLFTLRLMNWDGDEEQRGTWAPTAVQHSLITQHVHPAGSFQTVIVDIITASELTVSSVVLNSEFSLHELKGHYRSVASQNRISQAVSFPPILHISVTWLFPSPALQGHIMVIAYWFVELCYYLAGVPEETHCSTCKVLHYVPKLSHPFILHADLFAF